MLASLAQGGHLRVGMEDVLTISKGVPVESNAQLVDRAVEAGRVAQRTPMTTSEARALLGLAASCTSALKAGTQPPRSSPSSPPQVGCAHAYPRPELSRCLLADQHSVT